jgi:hypothetical protein
MAIFVSGQYPAMKTLLGSGVFASALITVGAFAADKVEIAFKNPETFADIQADFLDDGSHRVEMLKVLSAQFTSSLSASVGEGYHLRLTFTDIDLAGDYHLGVPLAGGGRARIINDFYPPRLSFDFVLTDLAGKVVAKGHRDLADPSFLQRLHPQNLGSFRYEQELLHRWARAELAP